MQKKRTPPLPLTTMNSNMANATSSSSYAMNSTHVNRPQFTNAFPLTVQGQGPRPWGPMIPQNLHPLVALAAQMQNNAWSQPMYPSMPRNIYNHNQQAVMPAFNAQAQILPTMSGPGMQDMSLTRSSSDDDYLLARVLYRSADKGQTYKQALESLHGVSRILYSSGSVLATYC